MTGSGHGGELGLIDVPVSKVSDTIVTQFIENSLHHTDLPPTFEDGLRAPEVMHVAAGHQRYPRRVH